METHKRDLASTPPELLSPSVDSEPGSSRSDYSDDPAPLIESTSETKSENERGESSSDDERNFGEEQAQEIFDDFMVSLPSLQRKTLAVLLMQSFEMRQKMTTVDAAQEAASIVGLNERTVQRYMKQFFENWGKFLESKQGKYTRQSLFNDQNLQLEAAMWVCENAYKKGEANATVRSFCEWVNNQPPSSFAQFACWITLLHLCTQCYSLVAASWPPPN